MSRVTLALARSLLLADAVAPTALAEALFLSATRGTSLVRTLLAARAIDTLRLEQMLERGEAPYMRHIAPVASLVERLPPGLCDRLLAMPVRRDPRTGTVDVAVVDARDPHPAEEIGFWLKAPVRVVRTSIASMESALLRLGSRVDAEPDPGMRSLAPPIWAPPPVPVSSQPLRTPMYGTPAARAKSEPPPEDADLAIPLTRRNLGVPPVARVAIEAVTFAPTSVEIGPPAIERTRRRGDSDPILDLKRRKPAAAELAEADPIYAPASTVRGPFAPAPPAAPATPPAPPVETSSILDQMRGARDRDQILDILVAGARTVARRAVVLAVRRDALVGWTGAGDIAERPTLRAVRLPNGAPTIFHESLEDDGVRFVRMRRDAAHAPLLAIMRSPPSPAEDVVVASIRAEGRPVALVFADGLDDTPAAVECVGALARGAGEALARLLRDRRT